MRIGSASETAVNVRDGYSSFVITLYKRSLTAIETTGINKLFFTFKNNSLSSGVDGKTLEECLNGWSRTVPNGKNPLYCTSATAFGNKDIDDIQPNEWTTPTVMSENGTKGENGLTTTTVLLYKRSDEIPETPQSEITYDFYSGEVIGSLSGWSTTLPDFNGKALWGTNATVSAILGENVQTGTITKEKWSIPKKIVTDGKDGKSPVESYIDTYTFLLVADQYGIISSKEYTTINAKVVLMQRGEKLTCVAYGSSLENGNFYITRAENGITNTEIELDTIKGTTDSVMLKDSASVILTITYKDLDGELGSLIKTVYIKKVYTPKEAEPMLFAWSSSEDVFTPKDTNRVWMYSDKYVQFDSKLIGDFALYNFVEWDEVIKAKSDDYPYLWCKYTPNGTPILFSGRDGKNGLNGQYTAFQYYASTSDTTQQGGVWSDTVPSIAGGKYLWMRTQVVPAGGSISSSAWGTPVLAGTDISKLMTTIETTNSQVVELGDKVTQNTTAINANSSAIATKVNQTVYDDKISSIESTIEQTASKIALTVETVNGEKVVKYNGIVISEKDGEGNILIRADKILLDGSVTADKLDVKTLNTVYLTINGTLDNDVLSTIDKNEAGEAISIGSVDDTNKYYLASQLKTKIKSTTANSLVPFSKLGDYSNVKILNNTDNSFFNENNFEYYRRFGVLFRSQGQENSNILDTCYFKGNFYQAITFLRSIQIYKSSDLAEWTTVSRLDYSDPRAITSGFSFLTITVGNTSILVFLYCQKDESTTYLTFTTDGTTFKNQTTYREILNIIRNPINNQGRPTFVSDNTPWALSYDEDNNEISFLNLEIGISEITYDRLRAFYVTKGNIFLYNIMCAFFYKDDAKYVFFKVGSDKVTIPYSKEFGETKFCEVGDYLYFCVGNETVGRFNFANITSSSTIEFLVSDATTKCGMFPISNKYVIVLEYIESTKTIIKTVYGKTKKIIEYNSNSSVIVQTNLNTSLYFLDKIVFSNGYNFVNDNRTWVFNSEGCACYIDMTSKSYSQDILVFDSQSYGYQGTIDNALPCVITDVTNAKVINTELNLNLPSTIPSDMDTYRRIPTLFTQTTIYLSLASASVESYTVRTPYSNGDKVIPTYSGKPSKVTTSTQSLRINDTEYANSSWFVKNKTALAITFTPNATAKGVYTGDLNPKEVDGEEASARDIGNITPYDTITGREITANEKLITGNIEAKTTSANIGSPNQKFNNVNAETVNAETVNAENVATSNLNSKPVDRYAYIRDDGVMEVGQYLDFHTDNNPNSSSTDYNVRLQARSDGLHVYVNGKEGDIGIWGAVFN